MTRLRGSVLVDEVDGHLTRVTADPAYDTLAFYGAARSATAAAGVCPRDQLSRPAEEGLGRDQGVPVTAYPSPEARGLGGQAPARGVGDPEPARTALLSEDAMLFLERVHDGTRLRVDPARDGHDEELQHVGNRRQTGRAEQRLSAVTNVATRRASSVESARRTASSVLGQYDRDHEDDREYTVGARHFSHQSPERPCV